ncbi:MAG TPA: undecaprenyl-diphosphate phosphatase [Jatrophihabitans sp.]|uniref:undecaprenyl-diphosphate phosphatase n=1 Tax=Jatrophihabitans sp. TaxID=1932789 RepID=UPI002DFBE06B|nr:undecaprenyl-diphosphate phosphatase [Jatrophihabitans sp.]
MSLELGWLEAVGTGLLQGVASVFPISGLGHAVVVGAIGNGVGRDIAPTNARYLFALLRVAVAVGLFAYFWRDWVRFAAGLVRSVRRPRRRREDDLWVPLILLATVPGCVAVAVLVPRARSLLTHPVPAALGLLGNGVVLAGVWFWWRRSPRSGGRSGSHRARITRTEESRSFAVEVAQGVRPFQAVLLGLLPVAALVPGISGVGLALTACVLWGMTHEQAVRITLIVISPLLLVWGLRELPDVTGRAFDAVRGQALLAGVVALVAAYLAAALLSRAFRRDSLGVFGAYCVLAGGIAAVLI